VLTASANGTTIFTVVVTEDGEATATLLGQLDHNSTVQLPDQPDEDVIVVDLTDVLEAFEGDNDPVQFQLDALRLVIEDDAPEVAAEDTSLDEFGDPATYDLGAQGTWTDLGGSDEFQSLNVTFDSYQINAHGTIDTSNTNSTFTQGVDDFHYSGSITDDFNGDGIDDTVGFDLTLNDDGTYDVAFTTPPGSVTTFDTSQGSLAAGGPDAVQTLLFGGSAAGNDDIVFFGVVANATPENGGGAAPNDIEDLVVVGATDLTEAQIEDLFPIPDLINSSTQMNVSTSGIGVNNNNLDGNGTVGLQFDDESFVVNPETVVDSVTVFIDNSVGGYNPATEDLTYTVYYIDGTVSGPTDVTEGMLSPVTSGVAAGGVQFTIDDDKEIDAVQLTMELGKIKIPVIAFTVATDFDPESLDLDFTVEMFDNDDDLVTDDFSIHVEPDMIV